MGYELLRSAIADYVTRTRAVRCEARQVLVVSGSQHALSLCSQVLLDAGDVAAMEDPGYPGAHAAFLSVFARVAPVEIDQEGLMVPALIKRRLRPRLVYVTPSHQCPLGMPMSLSRRLQLTDFAHRMNAWILEDHYLSEYRYFSRPLRGRLRREIHFSMYLSEPVWRWTGNLPLSTKPPWPSSYRKAG
jgi:GntR family transcriptional regulator/MocR family aminotransferase